jgi:hypothetical protein
MEHWKDEVTRLGYCDVGIMVRRRRTLNIQYSIENIQSFVDRENSPIKFFCHKPHNPAFSGTKHLSAYPCSHSNDDKNDPLKHLKNCVVDF